MKTTTIIIGLFLLSSCKYRCPDFNTDILKWIPYQKNDSITFVFSQDTSMTLWAGEIEVHHTKSIGLMDYCGVCRNDVNLFIGNSSFKIYFQLGDNDPPLMRINIKWNGEEYYFGQISDSLMNYQLMGNKFENARAFYSNEFDNDSSRVIIAKDYGILMIEIDGRKWIISEIVPFKGNIPYARIEEKPC
jgi:hypothetical protein